ncbi:hypothetical protein KCP73_02985 [Salmonella enterica subsp. enterica]|nr:hypothetical protein KCP73_02985 [Salmonella enterica subsp. enterica]
MKNRLTTLTLSIQSLKSNIHRYTVSEQGEATLRNSQQTKDKA